MGNNRPLCSYTMVSYFLQPVWAMCMSTLGSVLQGVYSKECTLGRVNTFHHCTAIYAQVTYPVQGRLLRNTGTRVSHKPNHIYYNQRSCYASLKHLFKQLQNCTTKDQSIIHSIPNKDKDKNYSSRQGQEQFGKYSLFKCFHGAGEPKKLNARIFMYNKHFVCLIFVGCHNPRKYF